jgi:hypothetical protein
MRCMHEWSNGHAFLWSSWLRSENIVIVISKSISFHGQTPELNSSEFYPANNLVISISITHITGYSLVSF